MTEFRVWDQVRITNGVRKGQTGVVRATDGADYTISIEGVERGLWYTADELQLVASEYITKDSGERQDFGNGSVRDTEDGKPRYDLITPVALKRLADLMARGAKKYGDRNWEKGQPSSRFLSSLMRHIENYRLGDREEDHLAAAAYNVFALMHFEGTEWDDINKAVE